MNAIVSTVRRSRRWSMAVLIVAALVLALGVAVLALRNRSHPVSLERAVERYRRDVSSTTVAGPGSVVPGKTGDNAISATSASVTTAKASTAGESSRAGRTTSPPNESRPAADGWRPPAPGVYTFRTAGNARFRIARHDYPAATHAILHAGDGCRWSLRHSLVEEDVDDFAYCTDRESFQWFSWKISRSFFGVRQTWDYQCRGLRATKADVEAKRGFTIDCTTDDGDRAAGTGSFVGIDDLRIGAAGVRAYHYSVHIDLEGSFRGTLTTDLWLEGTTGLRVRERRVIDGSIPAGPYHEELELDLMSLEPTT